VDRIEKLERCAYDAWPAEEVETLCGWRLRAMRGVTRRANSVWTFEGAPDGPIEQRIDGVEAWYAARGLAPTFQITNRSRPEGLDALLAERSYAIDAPVSIQIARADEVLARGNGGHALVTRTWSDEWFGISGLGGRFAQVADTYRGLLERIGTSARFALARFAGDPVAVGLGVAGAGWFGVFSMLTLPSARRRGAARAVLGALAAAAREEGIDALYLQVERSNAAAMALYAAASFRELYGYHYRVRSML
jgi:ribosomal protein S18 acetylase RimI-like enzyme